MPKLGRTAPRMPTVGARVSEETKAKLAEMAAAEGIPVATLIQRTLEAVVSGGSFLTQKREPRQSAQAIEDAQSFAEIKRQLRDMASGMQKLAAGIDQIRSQLRDQATAPVRLPTWMNPALTQMGEGFGQLVSAINEMGPNVQAAVEGVGPVMEKAIRTNNENLVGQLRAWLRAELGKIFPISNASVGKQEK